MAAQNGLDFESEFNNAIDGLFKNNTTRDISPTDLRLLPTAVRESYLNRLDDFVDEDAMTSNSATKVPSQQSVKAYVDSLLTSREFNRAFSETINFNKNLITYTTHELTGDVNFVIGSDNLSDQESNVVFELVTDGTHAINFSSGFAYLYGIQNGQVLDAGTYEIYMWYANGRARANMPGISLESSNITQLIAPTNFSAAADGENDMDLIWDDVSNESSYQIEYSVDGVSGWVVLSTPAADATTATDTGLSAGETVYYRLKAIGDGVNFSDSPYATAVGTTEDGADVTAPTFTYAPTNGSSTWAVNRPITITANEALRNDDGSVITDANVATRLTLKQTNSGGANIAFTATIDVTKTIITITPTTMYGGSQLVYLAIDNVEDSTGNEITLQSITFTTTNMTLFNGTSNHLSFGDILDTPISVNDSNFELEVTVDIAALVGTHSLVGKYDDSLPQKSFYFIHNGTNILFGWFNAGGSQARVVQWAGALTTGVHKLVLFYNGSIDTNNGLDRVILEIDDVVTGSKTLISTVSTNPQINNSTAELTVGALCEFPGGTMFYAAGEIMGFKFRSNSGTTTEIDVPVLRSGLDTSGNARHATWF